MPSVKGKVEASCPAGCGAFDAEVWTLINAADSPDLQDAVFCGEMNLLSCPHCSRLFYHETPVIYIDSAFELMVFVFPAGYESDKGYWAEKMKSDFEVVRGGLLKELKINFSPEIAFGMENLKNIVSDTREIAEESDVIASLSAQEGFGVRRLKPSFARVNGLPFAVPYRGSQCTQETMGEAVAAILKTNKRLPRLNRLSDFLAQGTPLSLL